MKRRTLLTGLALSPVIALAGALPAWALTEEWTPSSAPSEWTSDDVRKTLVLHGLEFDVGIDIGFVNRLPDQIYFRLDFTDDAYHRIEKTYGVAIGFYKVLERPGQTAAMLNKEIALLLDDGINWGRKSVGDWTAFYAGKAD